eukprot:5668315-Pyramimonas_sp.AAC.1
MTVAEGYALRLGGSRVHGTPSIAAVKRVMTVAEGYALMMGGSRGHGMMSSLIQGALQLLNAIRCIHLTIEI